MTCTDGKSRVLHKFFKIIVLSPEAGNCSTEFQVVLVKTVFGAQEIFRGLHPWPDGQAMRKNLVPLIWSESENLFASSRSPFHIQSDVAFDKTAAGEILVCGKQELVEGNSLYTSAKTFEELQISEPLLRGIYSEMKFERPSKIQAETLPLIMNPPHRNLVAQAHNGSGKTTCFVLGMLSRVNTSLHEPQALCVCPTRELALQNQAVLERMARFSDIKSTCIIPPTESIRGSLRGHIVDQVIFGTPGSLERAIVNERNLDVQHLKVLVFDEADHMLDQNGFRDFSMKLLRRINKQAPSCQLLLFSATFSEKVKNFVSKSIPIANRVFVEKLELSLDVIKQYRVDCPSEAAKFEVLKDRIFPIAEKLGQSIIFAKSQRSVTELHEKLEADGHKCSSIQGGYSPDLRDKIIDEFRQGITRILISTDVLSRGFDVAQVTLVVNFDLPVTRDYPKQPDYETYLHRIGRSGRFGRKGAAFNLVVTQEDTRMLTLIEEHFGKTISPVAWDDDEAFEKVLKEAGLA
ncbi:DEAD-box ATP-dependent RNA helicase 38 [Selaginella moellendorffii]|nr:DEAD-box ATP-dependent RNA helicase 38 [Selaginella moellendorffii]|eukprot:XP_002987850.2 DEAD-box ATP-dependent RNA helicase 38 [Selaginella moellendorffii]